MKLWVIFFVHCTSQQLWIFEIKSCRSCRTVYWCRAFQIWILKVLDQRQVVGKQWKVPSRAEKNNLYNGNFNNDNKTYLPARTTTLGYEDRNGCSQGIDFYQNFYQCWFNLKPNNQTNLHCTVSTKYDVCWSYFCCHFYCCYFTNLIF